jgi:hypothetical protein
MMGVPIMSTRSSARLCASQSGRRPVFAAALHFWSAANNDKPDGELLHLTNWVECVRSRKTPNAPVEAGVRAASAMHLSNLALRSGQTATWKE